MSHTAETARKTAKKSWARANRLAELTGHEKSADCRTYLASLNGTSNKEILDTSKDARTRDIRELMEGFTTWYEGGGRSLHAGGKGQTRRSKGDTSRPPRAGAPNPRNGTAKRQSRGHAHITAEPIYQLRKIQKQHDLSIEDLAHCVEVLGRIVESPLNVDQFLRDVKADRKASASI